MDPLSAVSLASAVIEFVDFGLRVSRRLSEYANADIDDVPKPFQAITTQLPLLLNALERVQENLRDGKLDFDTRCILKGVVAGCKSQIERVEAILNKIVSQDGDSLAKKAHKAFKSLNAEEKISNIEKNLQTYISVLILHHVIEDKPTVVEENTTSDIYDVPVNEAPSYQRRDTLLDRIDKYFWEIKTAQADTPKSVFLSGAARVGKTQLALGYCQRARRSDRYKIILWMDASSSQSLSLGLQNAANIIRKSRAGSAQEKVDFVRTYLANRWHPWLIVLDNYQAQAFKPDGIYNLLPSSGHGAYLFTSSSEQLVEALLLGEDVLEVPHFLTKAQQDSLGEKLFFCAENYDEGEIMSRRTAEAVRLIEQGADVNFQHTGWANWTAIDRAAVHGKTELVRILLSNGADPSWSKRDDSGRLGAVDMASKSAPIMRMLLDYEDKTNSARDAPCYDYALKEAAEGLKYKADGERAETVKMLLDRRSVSPHVVLESLGKAAQNNWTETAKLLLRRRAMQLRTDSKKEVMSPESRLVPLLGTASDNVASTAIANLHFGLAKALIMECSDLGSPASPEEITACLGQLCAQGGLSEEAIELSKYLLGLGVELNFVSDKMPLHCAAQSNATSLIPALLERGASPWIKDESGYTPLDAAASRGNDSAVKLLLECKADEPDLRQAALSRTFMMAIYKKQRGVVLALLKAGVDPNGSFKGIGYRRDTREELPLIESISLEDKTMIRTLLKHGTRVDKHDGMGRLPLTVAAEKNQPLTVRDILAKFPEAVDMKAKNGDTPLVTAINRGHGEVVKVLLEAGADRELGNEYEDTPLEIAEEKGNKAIIELLEKHSISGS